MNNEEYIVDGFLFSNYADYTHAKEEWNTVEYIKKNSDITNEAIVYKLYNKLNEKKAFKTVIGLKFQCDLRDTLLKTGNYKEEELKHIVVAGNKTNQSATTLVDNQNHKNTPLKNARIINIFLVLTILAMFIVSIYT